MKYIIESHQESQRLEKQNAQPQYSVLEEIKFLELDLNGKKIFDAGCGTGSLSRILAENFTSTISGCDASFERIQEARELSHHHLHFFQANLTALPTPDHEYDVIFLRFVLEHTLAPAKIISEMTRILKPGGHLIVIDLDGLIFNLHHQDEQLGKNLISYKSNYPLICASDVNYHAC